MILKSLDEILEKASAIQTKRIVVAAAEEKHVLKAVLNASMKNIVSPVLVGNSNKIKQLASEIQLDLDNNIIIDEPSPEKSARTAVEIIKNNDAEVLMKGLVSTSVLLKAVVDHKHGLLKGNLLSHVALCQLPNYHKIIAITDAAMNINPNFEEKIQILKNAVNLLINLGYNIPKVAVIAPVETENPKIESTVHAAKLKMMHLKGEINNCIVDGPLALDNIVSKEAAQIKGIKSEVAGDADLIIAPDLNSGNILYKSIIFFGTGKVAAIITGASVPIVLTSRADSEESRLYSIALAVSI